MEPTLSKGSPEEALMRVFAAVSLLIAALFWSYPFLSPEIAQAWRFQVTRRVGTQEPVLVLAPQDTRVLPSETVAHNLTESSEDPRR